MKNIYHYGWNNYINKNKPSEEFQLENIGRVLSVKGNLFEIVTLNNTIKAELLGKLLFSYEKWEQPKVGDWVSYIDYGDLALISDVLPRFNELYRKTAGKEVEKQVIVTNIDQAVVIQGLDNDFNLNRIERYLVQIATCRIYPVIILNKSDLIDDENSYRNEIERLQRNVPVYFCSVKNGNGLEEIKANIFREGTTSVLIGSSGVGKSTLINDFTKGNRSTREISESTGKGKHTTTTRDMFLLDNEAIVIDTPGMREFGVGFDKDVGFDEQFPLISKFANDCRYNDCKHIDEEGCSVIKAYAEGRLDPIVYESYLKLQKEQKRFQLSAQEKKRQGKQFGKMTREAKDYRKKYKF